MALDTYDPILGIILQATGNNNNSWGDTFNNSAAKPLARAIAGVNQIVQTSGTLDLSGSPPPATMRQDIDAIQFINTTLTGDLTIIVPALSKIWWFFNNDASGNSVFVKVPGGASPTGLVQIPSGSQVPVMCTGSGLYRLDKSRVGEFVHYAAGSVPPGALACNGASLLRAEYPDLFSVIGTTYGSADSLHFTLPNLTDTGRFLRSSTSTVAAGTSQANQNASHTHGITGAPGVGNLSTDAQGNHSHSTNVVEPGHVHPAATTYILNGSGSGIGGGGAFGVAGNPNTGNAVSGVQVGIFNAGVHSHNVIGAPSIGSLANAYQGGGETRPEALVCTIAIRY